VDYNSYQVQSAISEVPRIRFKKVRKEDEQLFDLLEYQEPHTSAKDVSCLRGMRIVNRYREIYLFNHEIAMPSVRIIKSSLFKHRWFTF